MVENEVNVILSLIIKSNLIHEPINTLFKKWYIIDLPCLNQGLKSEIENFNKTNKLSTKNGGSFKNEDND
jgi:hypothetical protein